MKIAKYLPFLSTLVLFACDNASQPSQVNIVRGRPLDMNSPAAKNVVGLSVPNGGIFCTGSVVADDMIVTAAHCVRNMNNIQIVFGSPRAVVDRIDVVSVETYKPYMDAAFPNFDIAWLKLQRKVPAGYQAMEILRDPAQLQKAKDFRLAGYGMEKTHCKEVSCQDELLEADTALKQYYDNPRLMSLLVFKGAAELGFGGSCNGDSGGPAYAKIDDRWFLIGVTNGSTAYLNPDSYVNAEKRCEEGSDTYTFMGGYVPWLEKRSNRALLQTDAVNPNPAQPSFVTRGEKMPADAAVPTSWAEWLEFPYHNEEAWNTVDTLLDTMLNQFFDPTANDDLIKLYVDPTYSQAKLSEISRLNLSMSTQDRMRFPEQAVDLRPLASWTQLQTLWLAGDAVEGMSQLSAMPQLENLIMVAPAGQHRKTLALQNMKNVAGSLRRLTLADYTLAELNTLPFAEVPQLEYLSVTIEKTAEKTTLDLSRSTKLKDLQVGNWQTDAKILLPTDIALNSLTILHQHESNLAWLDIDHIKSVNQLVIAGGDLEKPEYFARFQGKGIKYLQASDNGLTADLLHPAGFGQLETADLSSNEFDDTAFLKNLPALRAVNMRNNPLKVAECPTGVSCYFDRIPVPQTIADYCMNTLTDSGAVLPDSSYTIQKLLGSLGMSSLYYSDSTCKTLDQRLSTQTSLTLEGDALEYASQGARIDGKVLARMKNLRTLKLNWTSVFRSQHLADLTNLDTLELSGVDFNRVDVLQSLPKLTRLEYYNYPLATLEPISNPTLKVVTLTNLENNASLPDGKLMAIGSKTALPSLTHLNMSNQPLRDLNGVENFKSLQVLDISATPVEDVSPLSQLVGTSVYFGDIFNPETCPVLHGSCFKKGKKSDGGSFGSETDSGRSATWSTGTTLPGLGKAIRS